MEHGEFFHKTVTETCQELRTNPETGLTTEESNRRLEQEGLNEIPKVKESIWKVYIAPLLNWLIVIYICSGTGLAILNEMSPSPSRSYLITFAIVGLNCIVAVVQQKRAQKSLKALQEMAALTATVIRDGKQQEIDTRFLVIGDVVSFKQGDKVPADVRIIRARNLQANESSLTGESVPVRKDEEGMPIANREAAIQERFNMLFLGTFVATGNATGIVVKTGSHTEIGKISHAMSEITTGDIPLRRKVNSLAKILALIVIIILSLTFVFKMVNNFNPAAEAWPQVRDFLINSIGTAMSVMPINIPFLTTIILLTGVLAMASKGVIIRDLNAIESLGRVSVICTDKTGTLTKNQMTVQKIFCNGTEFAVTGIGYDPIGEIFVDIPENTPIHEMREKKEEKKQISTETVDRVPININQYPYLMLLLKSGFLNNNSEIVKDTVETTIKAQDKKQLTVWKIIGGPTEAALISVFNKAKLKGESVKSEYKELKEYSFDSAVKRMSKIFEHENEKKQKEIVLFTKGATEVLQNLCSHVILDNKVIPWNSTVANAIVGRVNRYANQGYRVLSFAYRVLSEVPNEKENSREKVEKDLTYLGFVVILDPPRDGVLESVMKCEKAGITVVMITGDSPATAQAIAQQLHIHQEQDLVVEGRYIDSLTDEEFERTVVFARVSPEHKQKIIERYQDRLHRIVAMTGDGVNDALALNMADAGIAMGITGTDVAKEAADMVISDDSFTSIATGVREGRGLFEKIRVIIYFYICANLFEGIIIFIASITMQGNSFFDYWSSQYLPITAHALAPFALVFDVIGDEVMTEKPRDSEDIFDRFTLKTLLFHTLLLGVGCGLSFIICYTNYFPVYPNNLLGFFDPNIAETPMNLQKARTMYITTVMIAETLMVLSIRRFNKSVFISITENKHWVLYGMIALTFFIHFNLMYNQGVWNVVYNMIHLEFNLIWLTASDWFICILLSMPAFFGIELWKYFARKKRLFF